MYTSKRGEREKGIEGERKEVHVEEETHFLLGVSAKHLREEVSTTVSQKATTGSDTLISV